jgi:hypothetical protein
MKRLALLVMVVLLFSCAALSRREKVALSEDRTKRARELDAARIAAEPFRRFEAAQKNAEALPAEAPEREVLISEARLWLETAITVAETASLARDRLALERETAQHDAVYLEAERERLALEDERERALASEIAREEMKRALARAATTPALRVKLSADETRKAALSLLARAELIALAIRTESAGEARGALLSQVEKARSLLPKAPEEALTLADQALLAGLALAGKIRDPAAPPSPAQKASLAEALSLLGATVTRAERGLTAALAVQGAARAANKAQNKESDFARLCSVARAYPAGDVQVIFGPGSARGASESAGPLLLEKHGCEGARFLVSRAGDARGASGQGSGARLSFTFLAY